MSATQYESELQQAQYDLEECADYTEEIRHGNSSLAGVSEIADRLEQVVRSLRLVEACAGVCPTCEGKGWVPQMAHDGSGVIKDPCPTCFEQFYKTHP